jgi:hypothetical protein
MLQVTLQPNLFTSDIDVIGNCFDCKFKFTTNKDKLKDDIKLWLFKSTYNIINELYQGRKRNFHYAKFTPSEIQLQSIRQIDYYLSFFDSKKNDEKWSLKSHLEFVNRLIDELHILQPSINNKFYKNFNSKYLTIRKLYSNLEALESSLKIEDL